LSEAPLPLKQRHVKLITHSITAHYYATRYKVNFFEGQPHFSLLLLKVEVTILSLYGDC